MDFRKTDELTSADLKRLRELGYVCFDLSHLKDAAESAAPLLMRLLYAGKHAEVHLEELREKGLDEIADVMAEAVAAIEEVVSGYGRKELAIIKFDHLMGGPVSSSVASRH